MNPYLNNLENKYPGVILYPNPGYSFHSIKKNGVTQNIMYLASVTIIDENGDEKEHVKGPFVKILDCDDNENIIIRNMNDQRIYLLCKDNTTIKVFG
jgi:hypothetical protein